MSVYFLYLFAKDLCLLLLSEAPVELIFLCLVFRFHSQISLECVDFVQGMVNIYFALIHGFDLMERFVWLLEIMVK